MALLQAANIPLIDDTEDGSSGSGLMHHKFLVIDQTTVITGSANLTSSGLHGDAGRPSSRGNVNHLLRINSPELALVFRQEFAQMWGDGPGGKQDSRFGLQKAKGSVQTVQVGNIHVDVLFSPHPRRDSNHGLNLLAEQLKAAKKSLDMALFVFSAQQLTNVLREKIEQGVEIRLVADPGFASRPFSEVLDLLGVSPSRSRLQGRSQQPSLSNSPSKASAPKSPPRPWRQAAPQVRRDRQQNRDHGILQLVALCCSHQRRNPAGDPLTPTRPTLHP